MVFGFGKFKMEIDLDQETWSAGDTLTGNVKLDFKKPTDGNELFVDLIGYNYEPAEFDDGELEGAEWMEFFKHRIPLGGSQEYDSGEFPFEFNIPAEIPNPKKESDERERWFLKGELDKRGLDVRKKIEFNINTGN